jgi:Uma2 family endonuclease
MRAVLPAIDPLFLKERKRLGADQWDEMWEGVLHMPPAPNEGHQGLEGNLEVYLTVRWARPNKALVFHQINLAPVGAGENWTQNYRIPDLLLLTPDRYDIRHDTHWEGAPNAVVEIHSPGDEAYEKLEFYSDLGVAEVWIIHRDSKQVEIYPLHDGQYECSKPDAEGWVLSPTVNVQMKPTGTGKLAIRLAGDETTREELPVI